MNRMTFIIVLTVILGFCLFPVSAISSGSGVLGPALLNKLATAVPGEQIAIIVRMKDTVSVQSLAVSTRRKGAIRANARAHLVKTLKARAQETRKPLVETIDRHGIAETRNLWLINGMAFEATPELIEELSQIPEVALIALDQVVTLPQPVLTQVSGSAEPNIDLVNAPDLWALGYAGQGVTVAIVDSGVDINHPDLGPRWRGGSNSWFDPNGDYPTVPTDSPDGHGTQVTGLVLGGNNRGAYIGVAPEAQWIGVKIFRNDGSTLTSTIHRGYQWLLDPDDNPNTDDAPDIVNNSWGFENAPDNCDSEAREFQPDIIALKAAGIAVVFAGGNTGPDTSSSIAPANYPESFAVGSVGNTGSFDPDDPSATLISAFSARGPSACDGEIYPDIVAPGYLVWTSDWTAGGAVPNSYTHVIGTSFATSHVSGTMALLLSAFPSLPVNALETALRQSATDLGSLGPDNTYGYGLVNPLTAFNNLRGQQEISVTDSISPETDGVVAFGAVLPDSLASAAVHVRNTGNFPVLLDTIDTSQVLAPFLVTSDGCSGLLLDPGASCSIGLRFAPTDIGTYTGSLAILSNVISQERVAVTLTGTGSSSTEKAISVTDSISPDDDGLLDFGQISPGATDSASIWVQNVGNSVLTISMIDSSLLSPPFAVIGDSCSGKTILTAEICTIDVRFAPSLPGIFSGSLDILTDATDQARVHVDMTGTGNTPPVPPQPLAPANGATVGSSVTFSWRPASDADGDAISQYLVYSTQADFLAATTRQVETVSAVLLSASSIMVFITLLGGLSRRRSRFVLVAIVSSLLLAMVACGGGGGDSGTVLPVDAQSTTVSGLSQGTTYYWKMVARDSRGAETQSAVRIFETQ